MSKLDEILNRMEEGKNLDLVKIIKEFTKQMENDKNGNKTDIQQPEQPK